MTDLGSGAFSKLGAQARAAALEPVSDEQHAHGRARLLAAASSLPIAVRSRSHVRSALGFAIASAVAAGLALYFIPRDGSRRLRYEVHGAARVSANYVDAARDAVAELRFSDGSELEAQPSSQLRVDETRKDGARVFVERGAVHAHVVHAERTHWDFVAGPFDVHVKGTRFSLGWDPRSEEIDLSLYEGSVEVESPIGASRCVVHEGQRFRASLSTGALTLLKLEATQPAQSSPPAEAAQPTRDTITKHAQPAGPRALPPSLPKTAHEPRARTDASKRATAPNETWAELVQRGAFEAVVSAANARGLGVCLATSGDAELRALADAARYSDYPELAKRALTSLRERFPHSAASAPASFLLGRVYESESELAQADRWYRVYLDESAHGEFAADALAGRMRSVAALRGKPSAKPIALEYLARYPGGIHAALARRIAGL